jgi:hypothetical protein
MMRRFQSNEGITLLDAEDDFIPQAINVQSGISDALVQFSQQLSGALQIPLVRLFGQSPAGLNSTGESDLRTYYDGITQQQERHLRVPLSNIIEVIARSEGVRLPGDGEIDFDFNSLWEMTEEQKSNISQRDVASVLAAAESGLIDQAAALREIRQLSRGTGRFTNITDAMIDEAEAAPPPGTEGLAGMMGGGEQQSEDADTTRSPLEGAKALMDKIGNPGPLDEVQKILSRINGRKNASHALARPSASGHEGAANILGEISAG